MVPSQTNVSYGESKHCQLAATRITQVSASPQSHPALSDPAAEVRRVLANPVDFPPLSQATVPGDCVAVVIGPQTPMGPAVALGVVGGLVDAGVEPGRISIVSTVELRGPADVQEALAELGAAETTYHVHDPAAEDDCAMVGVTDAGNALRINRVIAEADLIVPVGVSHRSDGSYRDSKWSGLYPAFADQETIERFRMQPAQTRGSRGKLIAEANQAGWLLGAYFSVQVVPAAGGGVAAVFAGEPDSVVRLAASRREEIWTQSTPDSGDLVVTTVGGPAEEQSWENVARAIELAERVVSSDGAVAVCCDLEERPGAALRRLSSVVDYADVQRTLARDRSPDAWPALVLSRALQRGPVYLRSRLSPAVVESIGMTPLGDDDELSRLAASRTHCVVIEDAQLVDLKDACP